MADLRIDCINKTPRNDPHDRIRNVGGQRWKLTEDQAIAAIDNGQHRFYVERPAGHRVNVIVATRLGHRYLKTTTDGEQPDNLLALPECRDRRPRFVVVLRLRARDSEDRQSIVADPALSLTRCAASRTALSDE